MSLILNIDSALSLASLAVAKDGVVLAWDKHSERDDNGWLHQRIPQLLRDCGYTINDLVAVATSIGPGSYTGLRIGLSAAKGLCFALDIPLIAINTLKMMAAAVNEECNKDMLICPVIDARRMEVFTATYDNKLNEISPAGAMLLDDQSFQPLLAVRKVLFCGNALEKIIPLINTPNAFYSDIQADARHLSRLSCQEFVTKQFTDLAYCEPLYIKDFFSPSSTRL